MTTSEYVADLLSFLEIPTAYRHLKDASAPYLTYYVGDTRITAADRYKNRVSCTFEDDVTIELHTTEKDEENELAIAKRIAADGWSLTVHEDYDYYEEVYEVTFRFTRVHKGKFNMEV